MSSGTESRKTVVRAMDTAFDIEEGQIVIRWMHDDFLRRIQAYTKKTGDWGFQLGRNNVIYDIDVYRDHSVGRNMETGEEYEVYLMSNLRHSGPGGR